MRHRRLPHALRLLLRRLSAPLPPATLVILGAAPPVFAQAPAYLSQPALHGDTLVFASEGDLWVGTLDGGEARRLTSHAGRESAPVLSPDGRTVAFRAEYQGADDVYVIPVAGGPPRRISYLSGAPVAYAPDGRVVVATRAYSGLPQTRLVTVDPATLAIAPIPLAEAADVAYLADGTLVFNRLGAQGSNARYYKGGTAEQLWRYRPGDPEAVPLTRDYPGTSAQPVALADGRVYFLSDRVGAMNVWSMDAEGGDLRQHTDYGPADYDIQELTGHNTALVYRRGADLYVLDVSAAGQGAAGEPIALTVRSDREQSLVEYETKPLGKLTATALSHDGAHVALVSRGELFLQPSGPGRRVHLDANSGVRYRDVAFGPDSSIVYALSDASGELEWYSIPVDGVGAARKLTDGPAVLRQGGLVSPDGKRLTHANYNDGRWLVDLEAGTTTRIADWADGTPAWSPDSRYLVFAKASWNSLSTLHVYDTQTGQTTRITSEGFSDSQPAFSANGDWLFFKSSRHWDSDVSSPWGERAPQPHYGKPDGVYAMPLRENARWPFTPANELLAAAKKDTNDVKDPLRFDLGDRLRETPVPPGDYGQVLVGEDRLFYVADGTLHGLEMKAEAEPVEITGKVTSVVLSADRKKLLLHKSDEKALYVIGADAGEEADLSKAKLALDDWRFAVDKRAEWDQIFDDAWRLHRDYFWDANMLGVDWAAMREKYAPLAARAGSRDELNDAIGQMVSELSLLHSNAGGGDRRGPKDEIEVGHLGAVFAKDAAAGGFRVARRFDGHPDLPDTWGPLQHPDVRVEGGDVIVAVNGRDLADVPQVESLLLDAAGKHVLLRVRDGETGDERSVLAKALTQREAYRLRYEDWERSRLAAVDSMSDGRLGYLHVQTMGTRDAGRFTRDFYNQLDKQGMIVDVRHNFGGNIDSWLLGQLMRRAWSYFAPRAGGPTDVAPNMQQSFNGPLVVLTDHWTASDGEAFADGFTRLGLGHTIGTRTWGGEVWLTSSNRQVDGGIARASEIGVFAPDTGEWLIEGWGFEPAEVVDNLPHASYRGRDAQLEAAVTHLEEVLSRQPATAPTRPAYPVLRPGAGFPTPYAGWEAE